MVDGCALMWARSGKTACLLWILLVTACAPSAPAPQARANKPMNPDLQLYQFAHDRDSISLARITAVHATPGPRPGVETVAVEVQVSATLHGRPAGPALHFKFERPATEA